MPGGVRAYVKHRKIRASVRKIGIAIFAMGLLGGAAILAGNLFPDQAYAVLQNVRAWIGPPATGELAQNSPAPQGIPIDQSVESVDHAEHRFRVFSGWLEMVRGAEKNYKEKHGRYGDLAALRKAHLLGSLVFESDSAGRSRGKAKADFVPKSTRFQVTVSDYGGHFSALIGEDCAMVHVDDMGNGGSWCCHCESRYLLRDLKDSPEGPIVSVPR